MNAGERGVEEDDGREDSSSTGEEMVIGSGRISTSSAKGDLKSMMVARTLANEAVSRWELPRMELKGAMTDLIEKAWRESSGSIIPMISPSSSTSSSSSSASSSSSSSNQGQSSNSISNQDQPYWRGVREYTRRNILKVLKFRNEREVREFEKVAWEWAVSDMIFLSVFA